MNRRSFIASLAGGVVGSCSLSRASGSWTNWANYHPTDEATVELLRKLKEAHRKTKRQAPVSGYMAGCESGSPFYEYSPWPRSVHPGVAPKPVRAVRYLAGVNRKEVIQEVGIPGDFCDIGATLKFPAARGETRGRHSGMLQPGDWVVRYGSHASDCFFLDDHSFKAIFHQNR